MAEVKSIPIEVAAATTSVRKLAGEFTWTVEGFSQLNTQLDQHSPAFELVGTKWKLDLCPAAFLGKETGQLALFLWHLGEEPEVHVDYCLQLLRSDGKVLAEHHPQPHLFLARARRRPEQRLSDNYGSSQLAVYEQVLHPTSGFLSNDTLRVKCIIHRNHIVTKTNAVVSRQQMEASVCDDLRVLLEGGAHRFVCVCG